MNVDMPSVVHLVPENGITELNKCVSKLQTLNVAMEGRIDILEAQALYLTGFTHRLEACIQKLEMPE